MIVQEAEMRPLGEVFTRALEGAIGSEVTIYDYGDPADFAKLWSADGNGFPIAFGTVGSKKAIVIVWDGRATNKEEGKERLLAPHLTPLDWALSFSIRSFDAPGLAGSGQFRVHIVDLTSGTFQDSWASRMRHQLLVEMPWVTLHASVVPKKDGEVAYCRRSYSALLECLLEKTESGWALAKLGKTLSEGARPELEETLIQLAQQWAASLIQSDDHHDLNNVVGPALLGELITDPLINALRRRCSWCRLRLVKSSEIEPITLARAFPGHVDILAIDDQLGNGWNAFICRIFGREALPGTSMGETAFTRLDQSGTAIDAPCRLFGATSPSPIVEVLETADFGKRDYSLRFNDRDSAGEIILLDLRLHSVAAAAGGLFYKRLLAIAERAAGASNTAWEPIPLNEIKTVRAWLDSPVPNVEGHYYALTLLPRLLALAAPMTPIIIFSSTGRAQIKEKLKPYRGIFTDFEKPRVFSELNVAGELLVKFREDVQKALAMLDFQFRLRRAIYVADKAEQERPAQQDSRHLELYFDESEEAGEDFTSAAAMLAFKDFAASETLHAECLKQFRNGKNSVAVIWARNLARVKGGGSKLKKFTEYTDAATFGQAVSALVTTYGKLLPDTRAVIAMRRQGRSAIPESYLLKSCFRDQVADKMLRFNLEFALCVLPKFLKMKVPSAIVYFDVRSIRAGGSFPGYKQYSDAYDNAEKTLALPHGLRLTQPKVEESRYATASGGRRQIHVKMYDENSYFPLVSSTFSRWPQPVVGNIQFKAIRGVQLSAGTGDGISERQASARPLMHDLADWVAGSVRKGDTEFTSEMYSLVPEKEWFVAEPNSAGVLPLMDAVRSFSHGYAGEGFRHLMKSWRFHTADWDQGPSRVEQVLYWSCHEKIRAASGSDLFYAVDSWSRDHQALASRKITRKEKAGGAGGLLPAGTAEGPRPTRAVIADAVHKRSEHFVPQRGEVCVVLGEYREDGKSYWDVSPPEALTNPIGYVACHEADAQAHVHRALIATATSRLIRGGQYVVFDFVDWLPGG